MAARKSDVPGDASELLRRDSQPVRQCRVEDCQRPYLCKGYCKFHYHRRRFNGDPLATPTGRMWGVRRKCTVPACDRLWSSQGYCNRHYQLVKRWGVPETRRRRAEAWFNGEGYLVTYQPNNPNARKDGSILQHRAVMAEVLGRPLKEHEIVHHRNGIRTDNRPENLELLTRATHPTGHDIPACPACGYLL